MKMTTSETLTPPNSGPASPLTAHGATAQAAATPADTNAAPAKGRDYTLAPLTKPLPRRVEKLLLSYLKIKARAGAMYAEAAEKLQRAMAETRGSGHVRVLEPGVVYTFSTMQSIDGKLKSTVQIVDNFALPEIVKPCRFSRYEVKTWKGAGPRSERAERAQTKAASKDSEEDALP